VRSLQKYFNKGGGGTQYSRTRRAPSANNKQSWSPRSRFLLLPIFSPFHIKNTDTVQAPRIILFISSPCRILKTKPFNFSKITPFSRFLLRSVPFWPSIIHLLPTETPPLHSLTEPVIPSFSSLIFYFTPSDNPGFSFLPPHCINFQLPTYRRNLQSLILRTKTLPFESHWSL